MVITGNYVHRFIVLLLEYTKLFYVLFLFRLHIEILAVSSFLKCLTAIKCSESRVETLQIFICYIYLSKNYFKNILKDSVNDKARIQKYC